MNSLSPDYESLSVLVVDDEPGMRTALQANFLRHGWNARTANGTAEATITLARMDFDLVVSDIRMKDGDGFEVLNLIRETAPKTAVILLTAFGSVPEAVESMRNGALDYLTKPVSFDQLQSTAIRVMDRAKSSHPASRFSNQEHLDDRSDVSRAGMRIADVERQHLANTLVLAHGNRTLTAKMLGISLRTVRNKIREYGLPPRSYA
jgi:DNA-binding NtrC family response regulator